MEKTICIGVDESGKRREMECYVKRVFCAGFTGRDKEKVYAHIKELAELGVPEPDKIPTIYRVSLDRLCMDRIIEVQGTGTSGEVEFVLLVMDDDVFVTIGSDHTDRDLERESIVKAKQIAPKVISDHFWSYEDVKDHWDDLMLRAWIDLDGEWVLYQEGSVAAILPVEDLLDVIATRTGGPLKNTVIFSGTLAALEGLRPSSRFRMELEDPVLLRKLPHEYIVEEIPGEY